MDITPFVDGEKFHIVKFNINKVNWEVQRGNSPIRTNAENLIYSMIPGGEGLLVTQPVQLKTNECRALRHMDGLLFSIRKFTQYGDRLHAVVYASYYTRRHKDETLKLSMSRHEYYTSISDGGFWRYCSKDDGYYHKGINYVSTTFINIHLQHFLFSELRNYNIIETTDNTCPTLRELPTYDYMKDAYIDETRNTLYHRIMEIDGFAFNPLLTLVDIALPHVDTWINYSKIIGDIATYNFEWHINKAYPDNPMNANIRKQLLTIQCAEYWSLLRKYIVDSDRIKRTKYSKFSVDEQNLYSLRDALDMYLTKNADISKLVSTAKTIFTRVIKMDATTFIRMEVKECSGERFTFYYMKYGVTQGLYRSPERSVFINIVPKYVHITGSGLDEKYVSAGVLVNKIFDYRSQVPDSIPYTVLAGSEQQYASIGKFMSFNWLP